MVCRFQSNGVSCAISDLNQERHRSVSEVAKNQGKNETLAGISIGAAWRSDRGVVSDRR
ncbi:MAG: hypothetical protein ACI4S9_06720 [Christensenellales bacterium]